MRGYNIKLIRSKLKTKKLSLLLTETADTQRNPALTTTKTSTGMNRKGGIKNTVNYPKGLLSSIFHENSAVRYVSNTLVISKNMVSLKA